MIKDFLIRLKEVLLYIPWDTWKMVLTVHLVIAFALVSAVLKSNPDDIVGSILKTVFWTSIVIYSILIFIFWRMHHGKGGD